MFFSPQKWAEKKTCFQPTHSRLYFIKTWIKVMQECKEHYETVCQTTYTQKNVLEDRVSCQMKQEDMCMDMNGKEHCIKVPKRVSTMGCYPFCRFLVSWGTYFSDLLKMQSLISMKISLKSAYLHRCMNKNAFSNLIMISLGKLILMPTNLYEDLIKTVCT